MRQKHSNGEQKIVSTEQQQRYLNPYRDIEYFSFPNKFTVKVCENPVRRMEESFDTLEEAIAARDARFAHLAAKDKEETN
jgi:hypothetical protein